MVRPSFIKGLNEEEMNILDWMEEIFIYNPVSLFICRIIRFIKRIIRWIPVLWKQEEWDFAYLYDIIEFKIKELRKVISKDTWHTEDCVKEELEQIDEVLGYLDRYRNWPNYIEIPEPLEGFQRFTPCENGCSTMNFTDEEHEAYDKAHKFEEENFNLFWDKLKEYHGNWWT